MDRRIRKARAARPQLNREALGCRRTSSKRECESGNDSLSDGRALRPGVRAYAAFHHTAAALREHKALRLAGLRVTVLRSGAERRNRSFPQVQAGGSLPPERVSRRQWERAAVDSLLAAA